MFSLAFFTAIFYEIAVGTFLQLDVINFCYAARSAHKIIIFAHFGPLLKEMKKYWSARSGCAAVKGIYAMQALHACDTLQGQEEARRQRRW
mmetsp:Transcript_14988/g.30583  ORF Transcript_14988/g.30583 Transcript_14988/m.30583 type:complete len:91 (+) Transcript_14988:349-621(+)